HTTAPDQIVAPETLVSWDSFTPTQSTPENTEIKYQFRVSTDGSNWTDWSSEYEYSGGAIDLNFLPTEDENGNKYRYLQIKTTLITYDSSVSPQIDEYQIQYSYADTCSDFDHLEVKVTIQDKETGESWDTGWNSSAQVTYLPGEEDKYTYTYEVRALDSSGDVLEGISTSVSSSSCSVSGNQISPKYTSCQVVLTSECGGEAVITISEHPGPEAPSCDVEGISEVILSPSSLELYPDETASIQAKFYDQDGNELTEEELSARNLTGDFNGEFFQIQNGGGVITSQNSENFSAQIKAGQTPGTYKDTIVFSACSGQLKAYADLVVKEREIVCEGYGCEKLEVILEASKNTFLPGEQATFTARAYRWGKEVSSKTSFSFSLKEDIGILSQSENQVKFQAKNKPGTYNDVLEVKANYQGEEATASTSIKIKALKKPSITSPISQQPSLPSPKRRISPSVIGSAIAVISAPRPINWVALALLSLSALFTPLMWPYVEALRWLFALPFFRFPRAPKKGVVFDFQTKLPIPFAIVKVFALPQRKLVYRTLTNRQGEFALLLPPGQFFIRVQKAGYRAFQKQGNFEAGRSDGYYANLYYPGEIIRTTGEKEVLGVSIPLIQEGAKIKWQSYLSFFSYFLFVAGTLWTIIALYFNPHLLANQLIAGVYGALWLIQFALEIKTTGGIVEVTDEKGKRLDLVLLRVKDQKGNLVASYVSDADGKIALNLSAGRYTFVFRKPGYKVLTKPASLRSLASFRLKIRLERERK
ncbi:carboxypeptidase regulatory-like domain-containing protein, partial [bacterium]|nr:carboxypeptidase regulatory-like domain-containing protein [bacterium]